MKTFSEFYEQLRSNIGAMPFQSRAIAVMLIGVIVVGVGLLLRTGSNTTGQYLFNGKLFTEEEIRKAEIAFGNAGLREYEFVGSRVRVPSLSSDAYLRALSEGGGLPPGAKAATQSALDDSSIFDSVSKLNQRVMKAKEIDIATQISQFPDIRSATVFYDSHREGFSGQREQSAAVVVVPFGNDALSYYRKKEITELVSAAYAGLSPQDVRVSDTNARGADIDPWDEEDKHFRAKKNYEREWEAKIRQALAGYGPPQVTVDVELDPKMEERSHTVTLDANPTTIEETSSTRSLERTSPGPGGVPGVASNAYSNTAARIEDANLNKTKESETNERSVKDVGTTHTQSVVAGLTPVRTKVVVSLRSSFYNDLWKLSWQTDNPEADVPPLTAAKREELRTQTKQEITDAVKTIILPLRAGDDTSPLVTVLDYPDFPVSDEVMPESSSSASAWLAGSWQSILLAFIALAALIVARGALKSPPANPAPEFSEGFGLELPSLPEDELAIDEEEPGASTSMMDVSGTNLKDELNSIIESNPDAAANVIRGWLGEAA